MNALDINRDDTAIHIIEGPSGERRFFHVQLHEDEVLVSGHSNGISATLKMTAACALAITAWITETVTPASDTCEVCGGVGAVLDPNHGDIPIACPECRTDLHAAQFEARERAVPA